MLGPRVGNNFPIMNSFLKSDISKEISENVVLLIDKDESLVKANFDLFVNLLMAFFDHIQNVFDVPAEV